MCVPFDGPAEMVYMIYDPNLLRLIKLNSLSNDKVEIIPMKNSISKILFEIDNDLNILWIEHDMINYISKKYNIGYKDLKIIMKYIFKNDRELKIMGGTEDNSYLDYTTLKHNKDIRNI